MTGTGRAGGAATIINAFATGRGVALGLAADVHAHVEPARRNEVWNAGRRLPASESTVVLETQRAIQRELGARGAFRTRVQSDLPPKRGLKSSSAVGVAVARAVLDHHGTRMPDERLLRLVADAAIASGTSLTGALDDAAACAWGGVVFTDNLRRRVLGRARLPADLVALVTVPRRQIATAKLRRDDFLGVAPLIREAWRLAEDGQWRHAMLTNTLAYAPLLGILPRFTFDALAAGAWAAGLTGKGPAEVALVRRGDLALVRRIAPRAQVRELARGGFAA